MLILIISGCSSTKEINSNIEPKKETVEEPKNAIETTKTTEDWVWNLIGCASPQGPGQPNCFWKACSILNPDECYECWDPNLDEDPRNQDCYPIQ